MALPQSAFLDALSRPMGFALLFTWYFSSARAQVTFIKERFGATYPRKKWGLPLLAAVGAYAGFVLVVGLLTFAFANK